MKCPKCKNTLVSPLRFLVSFNLNKLVCPHCGTKLKISRRSRYIWYEATLGAIAFGLSMALLLVHLEETFDWCTRDAFLLVIALVLVFGIPAEVLLFKYLKYDIDEDNMT